MPFQSMFWFVTLALLTAPAQAQSLTERVAERVRERLELAGTPPVIAVGSELVLANGALPAYYERALYRPVWFDDNGPTLRLHRLLQAIDEAPTHGLRAEDYHLERVRAGVEEVRRRRAEGRPLDTARIADLELLLSDAFLVYGSHLLMGRVNPETIHSEWKANRRGADFAAILERAVATDAPAATLRALAPPQAGYARLRDALARYRRIAARGGWAPVANGPPVAPGARDERVLALRARLAWTGDLDPAAPAADPLVLDAAVEQALRRFQVRHGLAITGGVDSLTLAAMNVPVEERVRQIELNLERWRWLPEDLGERHILVNIAGFDLRVIEREREVLRMRVMVGRTYRRTPVFSDTLRYIVLNPYWHVPRNIAVQDVLPRIRRSPAYLRQQGFTVYADWGPDAAVVDPATVDWSTMTAAYFPFRLRQDPGPLNALGRAKFMFPNRYNVYLHDTPSHELFDQPDRDFSSGCIRVEQPVALAEYLLADTVAWSAERITAELRRAKDRTVGLARPVPIHIQYWTAWVPDDGGGVQFRRDLYGRDGELLAALGAPAPRAVS